MEPEWFHGEMATEDATQLMKDAVEGLTDTDGTFFVRRKPEMPDTEVVLCVYYKGRPTHHLCVQVSMQTYMHP